jgi:hypothetical protein
MSDVIVAKFNPSQKRDRDGQFADGVVDSAARSLKLRGADGTVHVEVGADGGLKLRMPYDGSDDEDDQGEHLDTIQLDPGTTAELGEEFDTLSQMRDAYLKRAQASWDANQNADPGTPEGQAAVDAWFEIGGDGQRIAGGELDGDVGALVYEMRMGDEVTDTDFLIAIRPAGADSDWDLHEAAGNTAGQYLNMAAFRRLRKALPPAAVAASVKHRGGDMAELLGVELARPGTWHLSSGPREFTPQMLRDAADFYAASGGERIALGFGHQDRRFDGDPAFGWVSNVRYAEDDHGPVLLGDLVDLDDWVAAAAPKRWPKRSIEGVAGITFKGREYALALTRLALLGSTPPGIPVLKSLSDVRQLVSAAAAGSGAEWIAASTEVSPPGVEPPSSTEGAGMSLAKYREVLAGLPDGASEDEVKTALASAGLSATQPEPAPAPTPAPTPEPAPAPEPQPVSAALGTPGVVTIAASVWEETQNTIKRLAAHVDQAKRDEAEKVIASAVEAGKFTPAQKPHFTKLWQADPEGTKALIEGLTPNSALAIAASGYADLDDKEFDREFSGLFPPGSMTKGA